MTKFIAAFTISKNLALDMKVSNLVIGYSRVERLRKEYYSLPESERSLNVHDIFLYEDIEKAVHDHVNSVCDESCREDLKQAK